MPDYRIGHGTAAAGPGITLRSQRPADRTDIDDKTNKPFPDVYLLITSGPSEWASCGHGWDLPSSPPSRDAASLGPAAWQTRQRGPNIGRIELINDNLLRKHMLTSIIER